MDNPQYFELQNKLAELETMLVEKHPRMPTLLRDIHRQLAADPELVTTMTEEECSVVVAGLKKQTLTEISTTAIKKSKGKSAKSLTLADL